MSAVAVQKAVTLVEALAASFTKALLTPEGTAAPAALLWTDADAQWLPLLPKLRAAIPHLYICGSYDGAARTGPAIWLKCIVDRTIAGSPPADAVPILYLPKIPRQELRAAGDCPPAWQPLIELQYRGRVWHQQNGRDWSVEAFLVSADGLRLEIAEDTRTHAAILRALALLADTPIESLRGRRLDSDDFDRLAVSDPVREMLRWLSDAETFRKAMDGGRWQAFCNRCLAEFGFNPDRDGPTAAAAAVLKGEDRWAAVWDRFAEAPRLYPGVPRLLRGLLSMGSARQGVLIFDRSRSPETNRQAEEQLRAALQKAIKLDHAKACELVLKQEQEHGERREWVWAQLGDSPYAAALEPLARLASLARLFASGASIETMVREFAAGGWQCDRAALEALAAANGDQCARVVADVVRALYLPWLDASARLFQELITRSGGDLRRLASVPTAEPTGEPISERDVCVLFVDGLRFDIAGRLQDKLQVSGLQCQLTYRISPLPTVTATAKPMATPVHAAMAQPPSAADFTPVLRGTDRCANTVVLCQEMTRQGVEVLEPEEVGNPANSQAGAWAEVGRLDTLGHQLGIRLVQQIETELERVVERVRSLIEAGWSKVRVVTDHGWLLLPGGLPKVDLPAFLVETRWARCATVRGESATTMPTYSWHWNPHIRIACPPGIACFMAGYVYAHGGVSLQECVVPELVVERGAGVTTATITAIQWRGMRCRVTVQTNSPSVRVDLRRNWKQPESSIVASVKEIGFESGEASLAVTDDSFEDEAATVVTLDAAGNVLDRKTTTVGERS